MLQHGQILKAFLASSMHLVQMFPLYGALIRSVFVKAARHFWQTVTGMTYSFLVLGRRQQNLCCPKDATLEDQRKTVRVALQSSRPFLAANALVRTGQAQAVAQSKADVGIAHPFRQHVPLRIAANRIFS
jgi:hypothetical protein